MNKKKEILVVIGFFIFSILFIFFNSQREYKVEGDFVYVTTPQSETTLKQAEDFQENVYLIVGKGRNQNDYYQTELPVIPMGTVKELTNQYGDFRKCLNSGVNIAKEKIINLRLIGIDDDIKNKISAAYKKSLNLDDFLIKINGANLEILSYKPKSNNVKSLFALPHQNLLVKNIEITTKEDF